MGENGAGKTTLLKILLGELSPVDGMRHAHRNLRIGYFSQHHVDQLDMSMNSVEVLASKMPGKGSLIIYGLREGGRPKMKSAKNTPQNMKSLCFRNIENKIYQV